MDKNSNKPQPISKPLWEIKDLYIAKLLSSSHKYSIDLLQVAEALGLKYSILFEGRSAFMEISSIFEEKSIDNENLLCFKDNFFNEIRNMQDKIRIHDLKCNCEEFASISKKIQRNSKEFEEFDIKFMDFNEENQQEKGFIVKEFVINNTFVLNLIVIKKNVVLDIEFGDSLLLNYDTNGIPLDYFSLKPSFNEKVEKFIKENKGKFKENELYEEKFPEFEGFFQFFKVFFHLILPLIFSFVFSLIKA